MKLRFGRSSSSSSSVPNFEDKSIAKGNIYIYTAYLPGLKNAILRNAVLFAMQSKPMRSYINFNQLFSQRGGSHLADFGTLKLGLGMSVTFLILKMG